MADDFVHSDPEFTVVIVGPEGKEYINVWPKDGQYGKFWSGKDIRGNYVNINEFKPKGERQPQQEAKGW